LSLRAAVLTVSSSRAADGGGDESGDRLASFAAQLGAEEVERDLVGDDREQIEARLRYWSDVERCALVLTTGGTGFSPSDVTPEATRAVVEREAPGLAEAMRLASREHTPHWMLSRGVAGIRGATLIVNFPGSPGSIDQAGEAIAAALPHALELLAGRAAHPPTL
jgi:molybdenum cofactor synthesis domain-containing protein